MTPKWRPRPHCIGQRGTPATATVTASNNDLCGHSNGGNDVRRCVRLFSGRGPGRDHRNAQEQRPLWFGATLATTTATASDNDLDGRGHGGNDIRRPGRRLICRDPRHNHYHGHGHAQ